MKKFFAVIMCVIIICLSSLLNSYAQTDYWNEGHLGTASDPYIIDTNTDLVMLQERVNAGNESEGMYYKLTQNLDISTITNWIPIGTDSRPFTGHFDGSNMEIHVNMIKDGNNAVFWVIATENGCALKNLTVSGVVNSGIYYGGSIIYRLNAAVLKIVLSSVLSQWETLMLEAQ